MQRYVAAAVTLAMGLVLLTGCRLRKGADFTACAPSGCYEQVAAEIDYPCTTECSECCLDASQTALRPWTIADTPKDFWDLGLEEVVQQALQNSSVLHDLGGAVVRAPAATRTQYDAAIRETDPREGIEAALSAFDAELTSNAFFDKNDRQLNNEFFGGGIRQLTQDLMNWNTEIRKRAATGSEFAIRHHVDYDANNAPGNAFPSAFNVWLDGEIRHPLLQGSGVVFNRIAGPTRQPGLYNGVLIARLNTDVQLTEFEIAVRDMVCNLENAYWDLYFAYRDLDARIAARNSALETWRKIYARSESGRRGGEAEKEAQAREQYYRFQEDVQNALGGRLLDGTRTNNGSPGGTFRGTGGVLVTERRLRLLMSLPQNDGRLIRPSDEPVVCQVSFDWDQTTQEAITRRAEIRRQKWQIRRRELELIASKNHLLPRLDAVGRYRWRGFGKNLFGTADVPMGMMSVAPLTGASAYDQLTGGNFQEWQLGVELNMPIGFRRAHAGVRNAELLLARERAILCDQQLELVNQAADAVADVERAFVVTQTSYNRVIAAKQQVDALQAKLDEDIEVPLDIVLDAQQSYADAQSQYYRSTAEYAVATKNVHYSKGTLLDHNGIYLAEGSWPVKAYHDAYELEQHRGKPWKLNYASSRAPVVSEGPYAQKITSGTPTSVLYDVADPSGSTDFVEPMPLDQTEPLPPAGEDLDNSSEPDTNAQNENNLEWSWGESIGPSPLGFSPPPAVGMSKSVNLAASLAESQQEFAAVAIKNPTPKSMVGTPDFEYGPVDHTSQATTAGYSR